MTPIISCIHQIASNWTIPMFPVTGMIPQYTFPQAAAQNRKKLNRWNLGKGAGPPIPPETRSADTARKPQKKGRSISSFGKKKPLRRSKINHFFNSWMCRNARKASNWNIQCRLIIWESKRQRRQDQPNIQTSRTPKRDLRLSNIFGIWTSRKVCRGSKTATIRTKTIKLSGELSRRPLHYKEKLNS